MKTILVYDEQLTGHHLEYIHHLYVGALEDMKNKYVFAVAENFNMVKNDFSWGEANNVKFHFLKSHPSKRILPSFVYTFLRMLEINKILKMHSVNSVFFISLMQYMPFIAFLIPQKIEISGVIYLIYLYRWKKSNIWQKASDTLKYCLFTKKTKFKNVFILNDEAASKYLNRKFDTDKFKHLPDPFVKKDSNESDVNLKDLYNIGYSQKVFLHPGSMSVRKGTLNLLDAISLLDDEMLKHKSFVFAGKVHTDIKVQFYTKLKGLQGKVQILCFDDFCSYEFIGNLCKISDCILLPYLNTEQSSGFIGYGAQYNVPVAVPNSQLLGKLVKRNNLGYLLKDSSIESIVMFLKEQSNQKISHKKAEDYLKNNTVERFVNVIFKQFNS